MDDQFTNTDLIMVTVLRNLRYTNIVSAEPLLGSYAAREEWRPAFRRAGRAVASLKENATEAEAA